MDFQAKSGKTVDIERLNASLTQTQRLAGIGALTSSVAHELTNPISIITTTCTNLLSQVADDKLQSDDLLRYVQMIDHSAWRCARLLQTLRSYARLEGPQLDLCDLNQVVEDALTLVSYEFGRAHNIEIETDLDGDLRTMRGDQNQIVQVLVNLLLNARDSMKPDGGVIQIASMYRADDRVAVLTVRDTGPGIAPENLDRLFEPFFTTKPVEQGIGLGLSVAQAIVEEHGGTISAENSAQGGAVFTVVLPAGE